MTIRFNRCGNGQTYEYWLEQEVGTTGRTWRSESIFLTPPPVNKRGDRHPEDKFQTVLNILVGRG